MARTLGLPITSNKDPLIVTDCQASVHQLMLPKEASIVERALAGSVTGKMYLYSSQVFRHSLQPQSMALGSLAPPTHKLKRNHESLRKVTNKNVSMYSMWQKKRSCKIHCRIVFTFFRGNEEESCFLSIKRFFLFQPLKMKKT